MYRREWSCLRSCRRCEIVSTVLATHQFICFYFIAHDGHAPSIMLYWVMADAWWCTFCCRVLKEKVVFP
jgi:hypothetical protein